MTFSPHLWIYTDIVFGQLHLLMLGTELEAVPADTVSFELCIHSYLRASCVHSDRVCRLYSFLIKCCCYLNVAGLTRYKSCYTFVTIGGLSGSDHFYAALFVVRFLSRVFVGRRFKLSCRSSDIQDDATF